MSKADQAVDLFKEGVSCSQAVFATYASDYGLDVGTALKISGPFGGGMGRMAETCGALTGALMVIGLCFASADPKDAEAKQRTHALVREFTAKFKERNRSIVCRELLGFDISTPEGMAEAQKKSFHMTICPRFVQDAVEILEEMLPR